MRKGLINSDPLVGVVAEHTIDQVEAERVSELEFFLKSLTITFRSSTCNKGFLLVVVEKVKELGIRSSKHVVHLLQLIIGVASR